MTMKVENEEIKDENVKDSANSNETKLKCNPKRILQAISVLRQLNDKYYETCQKKPLLDDIPENPIFLQFAFKKIPALKWRQCVKVPLPNPLVKDKTEVCLITGDLDKHNTKAEIDPDILHYKEQLKSQNITRISEVITLRQLRTEYKSFEARRNLSAAYDIFLCDKKIAGVLPKTLGKNFYGSRKIPIQINMGSKNLKDTIDIALKNTVLHLTCKGNCCAVEVASLSMKDDEILSNISSSIDILKDKLPGQEDNIMGLYVKTARSKALPIYVSFDNPNDVKVKKRKFKKEKVEAEEVTTVLGAKVKVYSSGRIIVNKIKSKKKPLLKRKEKKIKKAIKKTDQDNTVIDDFEDPTPRKKCKKEKRADSDVDVKEDSNSVSVVKNKNAITVPSSKNRIKNKTLSKLKNVKESKFKEMNEDMKPVGAAVKKEEIGVFRNNKLISKSAKVKKNFKTVSSKDKAETNVTQKQSPEIRKVKENLKTDKKLETDIHSTVQKPKKKKVKTSK